MEIPPPISSPSMGEGEGGGDEGIFRVIVQGGKMLICTKCNIEYVEGKKFCKACGSPLVVKEEPQTLEPSGQAGPKETEGMLICEKCQVPYETGKYCKKCGSVLVKRVQPQKKEESEVTSLQEVKTEPPGGEPPEKKPVQEIEKLVCPNCKATYPSGKFCKKCGSALISQIQPEPKASSSDYVQETVQPHLPEGPSLEEKLICQKCKAVYDTGKFCKKCGSTLSARTRSTVVEPLIETQKEAFREIPSPQPPELETVPPPVSVKIEEPEKEAEVRIPEKESDIRKIPSAKKKPVFRPLYIGMGSAIIVIAVAGYLLWPKYSYLIKKHPPPSTGLIQKVEPPSDASVSHPPQKTQPITPKVSEAKEVEAIKNLLENIRQSNLQKNIDLFMSCYALEFKDREGRKTTTLENWRNFDYLELSYDLKRQTISSDTANARVEWFILTSPKGGGQAKESKAVLDVTFKKEDGSWKIIEIKSAG